MALSSTSCSFWAPVHRIMKNVAVCGTLCVRQSTSHQIRILYASTRQPGHEIRTLCTSTRQPGYGRSLSTSASEPLTLVTQTDGITRITLNDPKKRNALSLSMLDTLKDNLNELVTSQSTRVIIIGANGPVFSAGHDLKELTSREGRQHHEKVFHRCTEVMTLLQAIPIPVIAEVRGLATAAGCQLIATCDIAIASDTAKFATPGVSVGLFCHTPGIAVARAVPRKVAMDMLFTGHPITAQAALTHGLVSRVVSDDKLEEEVLGVAHRICETSQSVNMMGKQFFYKQVQVDTDTAYRQGEKVMTDNLALVDGQEGIRAFIEKRPPRWSHGTDKAH